MKILVATVLFLSLCTSNALAANADCRGKVARLSVNADSGAVSLSISGSGLFLVCSPDRTFNGVTPEICNIFYATLLTAKTSGTQVRVFITNAPDNSCSSIPDYFQAKVRFIEPL